MGFTALHRWSREQNGEDNEIDSNAGQKIVNIIMPGHVL